MRGRRSILLGVFALAAFLRLIPLLVHGGLGFWNGYDDGVYYGAADALTFGHLPYRDFLLLHPPGIVVVLVPFAALGRMTTDATGMIVARCFFIALGALNASLAAAIAWRWSRRAGVVAGALYACWYPAVVNEQTARLEVLGTTALLVALLLLAPPDASRRPRHEVLAGVALGLGAGVKIWGVAPWLALIAWEAARRRWPAAVRLVVGGAAALTVLLLPFFDAAPTRMFDMVVRDQFHRTPIRPSASLRLSSIFGIGNGTTTQHLAVAIVVCVVLAVAVLVSLRDGRARPIILVLAVNVAVLLASPSFYRHYAEYVAAPAVLLIAIAAARVSPAVAGVVALASAVAVFAIPEKVKHVDASVTSAAASVGCLRSDDPGVLIQMNRLSAELGNECHVILDIWGAQQDPRYRDWQQWLVGYLTSGDAFIVARPNEDALAPGRAAELASYPLLARDDGITLRRSTRPG